jgi:hypothetical protein
VDSYVIRIYSRDPDNGTPRAGRVEDVVRRRARAFSTAEQLWEMLSAAQNGSDSVSRTEPGASTRKPPDAAG